MGKIIVKLTSILLPCIFIFIASLSRPVDADLGWHLRYGQEFFATHSVARTNTFSTDMAGFAWANISWGIDLFYYAIFALGGFWGLTIAGSVVVMLTFVFFALAWELDFWEKAFIFPVLAYIERSINNVSFRGQLVSMMLLGLLVYLLSKFERGSTKALYLVPILFWIWANMHGQYILGTAVFAFWAASRILFSFREQGYKVKATLSQSREIILVGILVLLTPLLNPFGSAVYTDAFLHFRNPLLKAVSEYVPAAELSMPWLNHILILVVTLVGLVWYILKKKVSEIVPTTLGGGVFYILSFAVKRYSWSAYYFAFPYLKPLVAFIKPESRRVRFIVPTILFIVYIAFVSYLKYPFTEYTQMTWDDFCGYATDCSPQAARFLEKMPDKGHLYTYYGWGGWLIWNYRDIKPSMDGRMHLWVDDKDHSAFKEYYDYEQNFTDIDHSDYDTVFISSSKPLYNRLNQLVYEGRWKKVYEDASSGIFVREKNPQT
ncbi:MAG: hypothetical protein AAB478_05400 [Patescibacteria group bacterium]